MKRFLMVYPSTASLLTSKSYGRFEVFAGSKKIPQRPHVGIAYILESLSAAGIQNDLIDMNLHDRYDLLVKKINEFQPDILGFTLVSPGYKHSYAFIKKVKEDFPNKTIIVGGPHVTIFRHSILEECPEIDVAFISEAEFNLVQYIKQDCSTENIQGIIYKKDGVLKITEPKLEFDLNDLPIPKYGKFDLSKYSEVALYTSRGCPSRCIFCTIDAYRRKKYRARSVPSLMEEIDYWYAKGQRLFPIEDDNFTLLGKRVFELCDEIEKRNYKDIVFSLGQGVRADRVDYEMLRRLYQVGFKYVTLPVEGGNDKTLLALKKGETIDEIEAAVKAACEIGFEVRLLFVVGAPGETWADVEDALKFAEKYPVMSSRFNNLMPIPGTELYEWVKKEKLFIMDENEYLNRSRFDYAEPFYETPEFPAEQRRKAVAASWKVNERLLYRYLKNRFGKLGKVLSPIAFILSRKHMQLLISESYFIYSLAKIARKFLAKRTAPGNVFGVPNNSPMASPLD